MTMRRERVLLIGLALSLALGLGGCGGLDALGLDSLFNNKKPLPGDRKAVFPDGVPGVPLGVPPELVRGYQPLPEPEPPPVVAEKPKPKVAPKLRPKKIASPAPARPATSITVQPTGQPQTAWPQPGAQPAPQNASPFPPAPPPR